MEAALFTLDVLLLLVLIVAIRKAEREPGSERSLGFFAFLAAKSDPIQKHLRKKKGRIDA